jgi:hypothetical protein
VIQRLTWISLCNKIAYDKPAKAAVDIAQFVATGPEMHEHQRLLYFLKILVVHSF